MKSVTFLGDTKARLKAFPSSARNELGVELMKVQFGEEPTDWKPMPGIGKAALQTNLRSHMEKSETFTNVWDALADSPEEARNLTMRAELMISIGKAVRDWDVTQGEAAKRLGLTRPRMNDLLRSKINKFSLDALTTLAHRAGLTVKMSVKKANVKLAA